jgi:phospholipid transport system substrate-binding protein
LVGALLVLLAPLIAAPARAGEVTDQVKSDVTRVFLALEERRHGATTAALGDATDDMFDWTEMARRTLGNYWDVRTPDEREQFTQLLGRLVQSQIVSLPAVRGDAIQYTSESVERDRATVESRVPRNPGLEDMQLDYRLVRRDGRWLVYDVVVNNLSLVGHFRAQFQQIIKTASYDVLIAKLSAR